MASTSAYSCHARTEPNDGDTTPYSTPVFLQSSRRTNSISLSSSPSFSSNSSSAGSITFPNDHNSPFSGIPFSWEQIPGIPKNQISKKKDLSALGLLPLPPAGSCSSNTFRKNNREDHVIISPKKYNNNENFRKDPFFAALIECSKDDHHQYQGDVIGNFWKGSRVSSKTTTLSHRFGFVNMYASCKRTCAVSESIVYLPRSRPYKLLNRR
ncbi:hypothetical protein ACH5RR_026250 [Cinchona calisaya]|uniref:Uncharacterized protein n=1 Tax=Cinchona calisaya TaxID=153742 RepID=A0ABD2Z351_9GENT